MFLIEWIQSDLLQSHVARTILKSLDGMLVWWYRSCFSNNLVVIIILCSPGRTVRGTVRIQDQYTLYQLTFLVWLKAGLIWLITFKYRAKTGFSHVVMPLVEYEMFNLSTEMKNSLRSKLSILFSEKHHKN